MNPFELYVVFLRAVLLSFSGFATVPALRDALVLQSNVLTDVQLNNAIAISQASPGPLGLYVVVVGYFVSGLPGAVAGVLALATPALLAIPMAGLVRRGKSGALEGACAGVVVASCALMLVTGARLAPQAAPSPIVLTLIVVGATTLALTKIKPVWVIVVGAVAGFLVAFR